MNTLPKINTYMAWWMSLDKDKRNEIKNKHHFACLESNLRTTDIRRLYQWEHEY